MWPHKGQGRTEGPNFCDIAFQKLLYPTCPVQTYSLTVTFLVNPMLPKSVTVSKYLLTVTLFPCPEGVTVTEDVCITKMIAI